MAEADPDNGFDIGEPGDSPREIARARGWVVESFELGSVEARMDDGCRIRIFDRGSNLRCIAMREE